MGSLGSRRSSVALLVTLWLGSASGCSLLYRLHPPALLARCSGPLVPSEAIAGEIFFRDQVRLSAGDIDEGLTLVTRKHDGVLVVVGLSHFGTKLFAITQKGIETQVETYSGPRLPAPPLNFLYDLHRVRFFGAGNPPGTNGRVEYVSYGTAVSELWRSGLLTARTFPSADGSTPVTVRFDENDADGDVATRSDSTDSVAINELGNLLSQPSSLRPALVVNPQCGYTLRIVNVEAGQSD